VGAFEMQVLQEMGRARGFSGFGPTTTVYEDVYSEINKGELREFY
jgi:hypothetical protein